MEKKKERKEKSRNAPGECGYAAGQKTKRDPVSLKQHCTLLYIFCSTCVYVHTYIHTYIRMYVYRIVVARRPLQTRPCIAFSATADVSHFLSRNLGRSESDDPSSIGYEPAPSSVPTNPIASYTSMLKVCRLLIGRWRQQIHPT